MEDLTYKEPRMRKLSARLAYELKQTVPFLLKRKIGKINELLAPHGRNLTDVASHG